MEALRERGLYGDGLIAVDTPEMVRRYNACLRDMGLPETTLEQFGIDAMGWSPEIADELENEYYLTHGDANPLAIVLFPQQRDAPIFRPPFSFIWDLMKLWFDSHKPQVRYVTTRAGIWLDFEQQLDLLRDQEDLLMIDGVRVHARTPERLMIKAAEQRNLVHAFMHEQDPAALLELAEKLVVSKDDVGDLRKRPVVIDGWQFSDVRSFYTRLFDGTFVIRPNGSQRSLLLSKDDILAEEGVTSKTERKLLQRLQKEGLISYQTDWWREHLDRLRLILDSFLIDVLDEHDPTVELGSLNEAERKGLLNRYQDYLPDEYFHLVRLIRTIERGDGIRRIDASIKPFIAHPHPDLDESLKEVVWHLLMLVCDTRQVVRLYRYDKDMFFQAYRTWSPVRKHWAIQAIEKHYVYRMMDR